MSEGDLLAEKKFYNALNVAHFGDPAALAKIASRFPNWSLAWESLGRTVKTNPDKEWSRLREFGIELIFAGESGFPELLTEAHDKPIAFYFLGNLPGAGRKISVVGTRKATNSAKAIAGDFSKQLAQRGVEVISGLAMGIDTAAHEGALAGGGRTFAVLASSLDSVYPRQNENLAKRIIESGGGLISEYGLGSATLPHRFLERNRIVSGLSSGTLVIEAPENSGSLVTANLALNQNREVFVIPGPISHENYHGSHKLVRVGARLVASVEDIMEDLGWQDTGAAENVLPGFSGPSLVVSQQTIFDVLKSAGEALEVDKIQEITKMSVLEVNRQLTFLQIKGLIKESGGKYYL